MCEIAEKDIFKDGYNAGALEAVNTFLKHLTEDALLDMYEELHRSDDFRTWTPEQLVRNIRKTCIYHADKLGDIAWKQRQKEIEENGKR